MSAVAEILTMETRNRRPFSKYVGQVAITVIISVKGLTHVSMTD